MARVWHYDGSNGLRYEPEMVPEAGGFRLILDGLPGDFHAWAELAHFSERSSGPIYSLKGRSGWQIGFEGAPPAELAPFLPRSRRYGGFIDRVGLGPAAGVFLALSAIIVLIVMKAPDVLAPLVPMSWEKKLGDAMIGDFGGRICHGPGSDAAIGALTARLDPKGPPLDIRIANISMVNAVALPGGNIVVFQGLLKESKSADELAGVLGHEIGHVRNRDVMQSLLRQLGLSVVLGGANSNASGTLNSLVSSTYSREAESNADSYSIGLMNKARISPADTATFFARLAKDEKSLGKANSALGYLSSHPMSESREKKFRSSIAKDAAYSPVISPEQWLAITQSCAKDPKVKKDTGLFF